MAVIKEYILPVNGQTIYDGEVLPGWYWAKHKYWKEDMNNWLMIYVKPKTNWRGQEVNCFRKDRNYSVLYLEHFKDLRIITKPE